MTTRFVHGQPIKLPTAAGDVIISVGSLLRNKLNGDVGSVRWYSVQPWLAGGTDPATIDDVVFKVDVWRLGAARVWAGRQVEAVIDPDNKGRPEAG